jgi:Tfp pilus assembly protein PilX
MGRGEDGIGLIDAILALVVLLVLLVASSSLVDDVAKQANHAKQRVSAAEVAEQWLERLANDPLSTLQSDIGHSVALTSSPDVIAGIGYSSSAYLECADTGATENACTSGNPPQVVLATVTVTWPLSQSLAETTVIDPPYGTAVATDGYISVSIIGENGSSPPSGVTGLSVSINGTAYTPDSQGCVFEQEVPGTFTVSLTSPSGNYIDYQENTSPSTSLTVVAGVTVPYSFHYDQAATVTFQPSASPIATGLPVSVANGQLSPLPWTTVVAAGSTAASALLFPYGSGYTGVWYGDCTAEEPTSPASVAVNPGAASTATITGLAPLALSVTVGGAPLYGASITAVVNDSGSPDDCPADSFGLQSTSGTSPNPALSVTQVPPEQYTVTVIDHGDGQSTTVNLTVTSSGVTEGATTYPDGTAVPITAT